MTDYFLTIPIGEGPPGPSPRPLGPRSNSPVYPQHPRGSDRRRGVPGAPAGSTRTSCWPRLELCLEASEPRICRIFAWLCLWASARTPRGRAQPRPDRRSRTIPQAPSGCPRRLPTPHGCCGCPGEAGGGPRGLVESLAGLSTKRFFFKKTVNKFNLAAPTSGSETFTKANLIVMESLFCTM